MDFKTMAKIMIKLSPLRVSYNKEDTKGNEVCYIRQGLTRTTVMLGIPEHLLAKKLLLLEELSSLPVEYKNALKALCIEEGNIDIILVNLSNCDVTVNKVKHKLKPGMTKRFDDMFIEGDIEGEIAPVCILKQAPYYIPTGNAGTLIKGEFVTETPQGCPKSILLRNLGIYKPIDKNTQAIFAMGNVIEDQYLNKFPDIVQSSTLHIQVNEKVQWNLEMDGIDDEWIYEIKHTGSAKQLTNIFMNKHFKLDNALQLCYYLVGCEREKGKLIYVAGTESVKNNISQMDTIEFIVTREKGNFFIKPPGQGKKQLPFNERHIKDYLEFVGELLTNTPKDLKRPIGFDANKDPCTWCWLRGICDEVTDLGEFIFLAEQEVEMLKEIEEVE